MNALTTIRAANQVIGAIAPRTVARFARRLLMTPSVAARRWDAAWAPDAERITFRFGLSAVRWGSSGPVVLMMHGWEGRPTQFRHLVPGLLAAGRQVIALEGPAHGRSPGREANVFTFAEALHEAAGELRGVESVIGHSMGGGAALYALHHGLKAERAAVIGSPAALRRVLHQFAQRIALPESAEREFHQEVDNYVGISADEMDFERVGGSLQVPGLIVHDRDDESVPFSEGEALARAWQGARFVATQGLGHRKVLADPGVVNTINEFLLRGARRAQLAA